MKRTILLIAAISLMFNSVFSQKRSSDYITYYGHLKNTAYKVLKQKEITIAYLGGSITDMKGWRDMVSQNLEHKYPDTKFTFINAGIPSLGSFAHVFRLQRDLLDTAKVDLLFIESAVNDAGNGKNEKTQRRSLEGIVRHALKINPNIDMVMMAFVDQNKMTDYRSGRIPKEVRVHDEIAKYYQLPFINLAKEITDRIEAGEFTWENDFKNLHPSPFGQTLYFNTISTLFSKDFEQDIPSSDTIHQLPSPLDIESYTDGNYLSIKQVRKQKGSNFIPKWKPIDGVSTRKGFVNIPVLEGKGAGSSCKLIFRGNVLGMVNLSGPDAGFIDYQIDGKNFDPIDLYTKDSKRLHLPRYLLLADDLGSGKHRLKITISQPKEVTMRDVIRIPWFLVNGPQ